MRRTKGGLFWLLVSFGCCLAGSVLLAPLRAGAQVEEAPASPAEASDDPEPASAANAATPGEASKEGGTVEAGENAPGDASKEDDDTAAASSEAPAQPTAAPAPSPAPPPAPPVVRAEPTTAQALPPQARRYLDELRPFFDGQTVAQKQEALARFENAADPAVVSALRYVARHDAAAAVAATAVRVLGTLRPPEATEALTAIARSSHRSTVWQAALGALGDRGEEAAGRALFELASDTDLLARKRRLALSTLETRYPKLAATLPRPRVAGSRAIPTVAGAFFGGYTLYTVGTFALSDAGPAIGAVGGTLIGATTGFLLAQNLSTDRALFFSSAMAWGLTDGILLTNATSRFPDGRLRLSMGVLGEVIGAGAAYLVADSLDLSTSEVLYIDVNGLAGALLGMGIGWINDSRDWRVTPGLALVGSLIGLGASGLTAKWAHLTSGDLLLSAWSAIEGGWLGAWMPVFIDPLDTWGAFWVGSTLGLAAGEAIAHVTDLKAGQVGQMAMLSIFGKTLGAGLSLLGEGSDRTITAAQLLAGLGGIGAGVLLRDTLHFSGGDSAAVLVATGAGLWHGLALGGYLNAEDRISGAQFGGLALTLPALFGLGAVAVTQVAEPSPWEVAMGSIGGLWGAWFVAWAAALGDWFDDPSILLAMLGGSDAGLLVTSILVSPIVSLDPMIVAGASVGGLVLTGLATLTAAMLSEDPNTLIATNLVASGLGLAAGGALTWFLLERRSPQPKAEAHTSASRGLDPPHVLFSFEPAQNSRGEIDGGLLVLSLTSS